MYFFLFNRTVQVFVTYLTGVLYVHPLWVYKHQHDNRVRSNLFVVCQRWRFQWRLWFVPSVPGYMREEDEHKPDPWRNPIERQHMGVHLENEVAVVKTPTIISNNPVLYNPMSNQLHPYAFNTGIHRLTYPLLLLFLFRQFRILLRMVVYALSRTHPGQRLLV